MVSATAGGHPFPFLLTLRFSSGQGGWQHGLKGKFAVGGVSGPYPSGGGASRCVGGGFVSTSTPMVGGGPSLCGGRGLLPRTRGYILILLRVFRRCVLRLLSKDCSLHFSARNTFDLLHLFSFDQFRVRWRSLGSLHSVLWRHRSVQHLVVSISRVKEFPPRALFFSQASLPMLQLFVVGFLVRFKIARSFYVLRTRMLARAAGLELSRHGALVSPKPQ